MSNELRLMLILLGISVLVLLFIFLYDFISYEKLDYINKFHTKLLKTKKIVNVLENLEMKVQNKKNFPGRKKFFIDFIVISKQKIFCIYYLNLKGYIYGSSVKKIWWCIDSDKKKFINPFEIIYHKAKEVENSFEGEYEIFPVVIYNSKQTDIRYVNYQLNIPILSEEEFFDLLDSGNLFRAKYSRKVSKKILNKLIIDDDLKNSNNKKRNC